MVQIPVPDDQLWDFILAAGIAEADVLTVIRARVCTAVESAQAAIERLTAAGTDCALHALGAAIPTNERRGYGPAVSQRDADGGRRAIAALIQKQRDEITNPPVQAVASAALRGLARRLAAGETDNVALLIEHARRQQSTRGAGTCRECGCIDSVACKNDCTWVDDTHTLCSACVPSTTSVHDGS